MNNITKKFDKNTLMSAGFVLLFPGSLITSLNDSRAWQAVGVLMVLAASILFGMAMRLSRQSKE